MLGILLMELYYDEPCQASWHGSQPSRKDLQDTLDAWFMRKSWNLPQPYIRAVRACLMVGSAPISIAQSAGGDLDGIADDVDTVYRRSTED